MCINCNEINSKKKFHSIDFKLIMEYHSLNKFQLKSKKDFYINAL